MTVLSVKEDRSTCKAADRWGREVAGDFAKHLAKSLDFWRNGPISPNRAISQNRLCHLAGFAAIGATVGAAAGAVGEAAPASSRNRDAQRL